MRFSSLYPDEKCLFAVNLNRVPESFLRVREWMFYVGDAGSGESEM